jgi:hypothetical protein
MWSTQTNKNYEYEMCWPRLRFFAGLLSLTLGFLLVIVSTTDTAIARRPPAWQLVDWDQSACLSIDTPNPTTYYGIYINGRWNSNINAGLRNPPAGSMQWGSYLPVPPGSSTGEYSLAYVALEIAPDTPVGFYTISLWASDGTTRQSVPVTLEVAKDCGY